MSGIGMLKACAFSVGRVINQPTKKKGRPNKGGQKRKVKKREVKKREVKKGRLKKRGRQKKRAHLRLAE